MLVYPRFTLGLLYFYLAFRIFHINGYLSFRGHNKALAAEECLKVTLLVMTGTAIWASLGLLGVTPRLRGLLSRVRVPFWRKNK
jgi:hypothetical protein